VKSSCLSVCVLGFTWSEFSTILHNSLSSLILTLIISGLQRTESKSNDSLPFLRFGVQGITVIDLTRYLKAKHLVRQLYDSTLGVVIAVAFCFAGFVLLRANCFNE